MKDGKRFELKLSPAQRSMLDELSVTTGISVSDLVRLGVHFVTRDKQGMNGGNIVRVERRNEENV